MQETPRSSFFKPSKVIRSSVGQDCTTCTQARTPFQAVTSIPNNASLASMSQEELADVIREVLDGSGRPDLFMCLFGLLRCKDTSVGKHEMRGISGGERKRLSTVEMLAGAQRVLVLDEISTGLVRPKPPVNLSRFSEQIHSILKKIQRDVAVRQRVPRRCIPDPCIHLYPRCVE